SHDPTPTPTPPFFPYTTLFRSRRHRDKGLGAAGFVVLSCVPIKIVVEVRRAAIEGLAVVMAPDRLLAPVQGLFSRRTAPHGRPEDRKSTRLNSSHVAISYAVFC